MLGKWLARQPAVLILDEPTRGVDVGAKSEIYALMDQLAGDGVAILMISSDLEEVSGHERPRAGAAPRPVGRRIGRGELTEEGVMNLATGGETR